MLKTYRIIPLLFILFVFGLTLITVSPVLAEDSSEFVACQQIKPSGDFRLMKQKKNCFRDVARALQDQSGDSVQSVAPTEPSGGEVAQLNALTAQLDAQNATPTVDYDEIMNSWNNDKSNCMGRMVQTIRQLDVGGRLTLSFMERRNTQYKGRMMLDKCELSLD